MAHLLNNAACDNTVESMFKNRICLQAMFMSILNLKPCFTYLLFFVPSIGSPWCPINIFQLIFSGLLDLDPLPFFPSFFSVLWIHYKDTKENNFICRRKTQSCTGREGRIKMSEEGQFYQRIVFISSLFSFFLNKWK